jgi:hypothetical protein
MTDPNMSHDLPPYSIQDTSQFINVTVLFENNGNVVDLGNLSRPLRFQDIADRLIQLGKCTTDLVCTRELKRPDPGFTEPNALVSDSGLTSYPIVVADGPTSHLPDGSWQINRYVSTVFL